MAETCSRALEGKQHDLGLCFSLCVVSFGEEFLSKRAANSLFRKQRRLDKMRLNRDVRMAQECLNVAIECLIVLILVEVRSYLLNRDDSCEGYVG